MNFKIRSKKMNKGGGITIPSDIRKLYGFSPDEPVKIEVQADGSLLLTQHRRVCMICSNSDHVEVLDGVAICLECATKLAEKFNLVKGANSDNIDNVKDAKVEVKEISNAIDKDITDVTSTEQLSILNKIVNSIEVPSTDIDNKDSKEANIEVNIEAKPVIVEDAKPVEIPIKKEAKTKKSSITKTTKKKEKVVKDDEIVVSKDIEEIPVDIAPAKKKRTRKAKTTSNAEVEPNEVSVTATNSESEVAKELEEAALYILEEHEKIRSRKKRIIK